MSVKTVEATWERAASAASANSAGRGLGGPILLATNGEPGADAAVRVAAALGAEHEVPVRVITVLEPIASMYAAVGVLTADLPDDLADRARTDRQASMVRHQLAGGGDERWLMETRLGQVARTITTAADEIGAGMIVLGIGRHRPVDRLLGSETALQVSRVARVPVLAVHPDTRVPLRRGVAAVDFSRSSFAAARSLAMLLSPPSHIWLAHVQPPLDIRTEASEGWAAIYAQGVIASFRRLGATFDLPAGVTIHPVVLDGNPTEELLAFADRHEANIIAAGTHGHTLIERILIGSVATKLLRGASCAVLLTPMKNGRKGS